MLPKKNSEIGTVSRLKDACVSTTQSVPVPLRPPVSHSSSHSVFPFAAIIGQDALKQSLLLNAVNPAIGGVLIRGEKGTAKSTAVRALAAILPEIDVVAAAPMLANRIIPRPFVRIAGGRPAG